MITSLELRRQFAHIFLGLVLSTLIALDIVNFYHMLFATMVVFVMSTIMKRGYRIWGFSNFVVDYLERSSEKKGMPLKGGVFYFLGVTVTMFLFSKEIVLAAIMILAFGDSLSRLIGPYGYLKNPFNNVKFIEGIIVAGIISAFIACIFVPVIPAFIAAGMAMFVEGLDIEINGHKVDDNLTIPVIAGLVIHILVLL